jgi:hypothetical protein
LYHSIPLVTSIASFSLSLRSEITTRHRIP